MTLLVINLQFYIKLDAGFCSGWIKFYDRGVYCVNLMKDSKNETKLVIKVLEYNEIIKKLNENADFGG